ncbi:hypothetical protein [Streptomyces sp. NPDC006638]|uniref:hypothetical protein n=1 Tax=Streptomyces sp. NPDC006638 TaxID=3157183 RepID=UPI00339DE74C
MLFTRYCRRDGQVLVGDGFGVGAADRVGGAGGLGRRTGGEGLGGRTTGAGGTVGEMLGEGVGAGLVVGGEAEAPGSAVGPDRTGPAEPSGVSLPLRSTAASAASTMPVTFREKPLRWTAPSPITTPLAPFR